MIHVTEGQLRKAFQRHRQPTLAQSEPRGLLLFYSVESGLKAAWLRRNSLRDTSAIDERLRDGGHDLLHWTKELRLPAVITNHRRTFRLRSGTCHGIEALHLAWRYGADLEPRDQAELEEWLERAWTWTKEELGL